jgi:hypothetical protein
MHQRAALVFWLACLAGERPCALRVLGLGRSVLGCQEEVSMGHGRALVAGAYVALVLAGIGCDAGPEGQSNGLGMPTAGTFGGAGGASGAGVSGAGGTGTVVPGTMPCEVQTVVQGHCQSCHGASPVGGAPMQLLTVGDFQRDYTALSTTQLVGQTFKMYDLARIRMNREMGTMPMPQGSVLTPAQLTMMNSWLMSGAPAGNACAPTGGTGGAAGDATVPSGGMGGAGAVGSIGGGGGEAGTGAVGPAMIDDQCTTPGAFDPLTPKYPNETCYDFPVHGQSGTSDTSKFQVPMSESYNQFYYNVPWPAGSVATRFGQRFDNKAVLHHWLAFSQTFSQPAGTVEPNVTGTTLFTDAELIAGWAIGGCTTTYPDNVGVHLPSSGAIMVQWHHYNNTGAQAMDGSAVQICVVPEGEREHKAGLTFLGTETMTVPAGQMASAGGTCLNDSSGPITILGFTPHMHTIGIHMQSEVTRAAGGAVDNVFDLPFQFDYQTNYMMNPPVVLQPGDSIKSTCTYQNMGSSTVSFGQSTTQEMCYQFAVAYPYGALNNGVFSLIGAANTCW